MYSDLLKKTKCCYKSVSSLHVEVSSGKMLNPELPWCKCVTVCVCVWENDRDKCCVTVWRIFVVRSALNVHLEVFFNYQSLYQSNKFIIEHHIMYNLQKPYSSPLVTKVSMHFVLLRFQKNPKQIEMMSQTMRQGFSHVHFSFCSCLNIFIHKYK